MPISQLLWVGARKRVFSLMRTTDQDITSGTSFVQDDQLGCYTEAGHTYSFEHVFGVGNENQAFELKYTHSGTTTTFYANNMGSLHSIAGTFVDDNMQSWAVEAINTVVFTLNAKTITGLQTTCHVMGVLIVGASGGIFVPEFRATTTSSPFGELRMYSGSSLRIIDWTP